MRSLSLCIPLVLAAGIAAGTPAPLQVVLRAETQKTLPGIPVDLRLMVTNRAAAAVELPTDDFMIRAERAGQPPFWVFDGINVHGHVAFDLPKCANAMNEGFALPPRSTMEYAIGGDPSGSKSWWEDPRLNVPGTWRLQVILNPPRWAHGRERPDDATSDAALGPDALISSVLTIVVEEPHGDDAVVWQKLLAGMADQELRGIQAHRWASPALAAELLEAYPHSRYAPWLALRLRRWGNAADRDNFRRKYGQTPLAEELDLEVLTARSASVGKLGLRANAADVTTLRTQMEAFVRTAKHPVLRCSMAREIETLSRAVRNPPLVEDARQ